MASAEPDKLIISNRDRLTQKYKAAGVTAIDKAVKKLIQADAARGLVSVFVEPERRGDNGYLRRYRYPGSKRG